VNNQESGIGGIQPEHDISHAAVSSGLVVDGGEGGIRTHAPLAQRPLFESGTMNHSVTSPWVYFELKLAGLGSLARFT
jgi:hypothetical protein